MRDLLNYSVNVIRGFYCSLKMKRPKGTEDFIKKKKGDKNKEYSSASQPLHIENCTSFIHNFEVLMIQPIHIVVF